MQLLHFIEVLPPTDPLQELLLIALFWSPFLALFLTPFSDWDTLLDTNTKYLNLK